MSDADKPFPPKSKESGLGEILRALGFAADKHRNQRRKDAEASPYINHPIAVACVLAGEAGLSDSVLLLAAILHDTVEDTETTFEELRREFGVEVATLVHEVTDDKSLPKVHRKQLQIEHATTASPRAKCLKIADKICNVRDVTASPPVNWPPRRRREYLDWAAQVVDRCRQVEPALDKIFDEDVLSGALGRYDWLHLHHEDFTGQYGKFYAVYGLEQWYLEQKQLNEELAAANARRASSLFWTVFRSFRFSFSSSSVKVPRISPFSFCNRFAWCKWVRRRSKRYWDSPTSSMKRITSCHGVS